LEADFTDIVAAAAANSATVLEKARDHS